MQYIITTVDPVKNSGGNKAKKDIDHFASQLENTGVIHLPIYATRAQRFLFTRLNILKQIKNNPAERYILQYPVPIPFVLRQIVSIIRKYTNAELDFIIHDLPGLQFPERDRNAEITLLNSVDNLIVHNPAMKSWLIKNNVKTNMICLGLFDYDNPTPMKVTSYNSTICFPGNLAKSIFLTKVSFKHQIDIYGPNKLKNYPKCVRYLGQYTPEELPKHLNENFGLIWDGDSIETCSGTFGKYLKYNNPHKASLYLSSGIPVIIWNEAALASLIKENRAGICIDSLKDLDKILSSITNKEYQIMKKNAEKLGQKLRNGYYIKRALTELTKN